MRVSRLVLAMSFLVFAMLPSCRCVAQSVYGKVTGRLMTASGTPVSGAKVSMVSVATAAPASSKTDSDGYFTISNLAADLYQIEVRADGFKAIRSTIVVSADSTASVNAVLQRGDPSAVIEKSPGEISVLQLDRTDVSTLFDSRSVADLPLVNRNLTRLELLVPGAQPVRISLAQNQNPQNSQTVNINGQHFSGSAFQLDGTEDRDPLEGLAVINPTLDSVREMKVTTQGYNAEFGQATAGVVTIQTRSGSNSWHGDGFGYRRTGFGQTDDPFSVAGVPPQKNAIFGGSLGGPILRNKLFVFGDYQGTRSSTGANVMLSVPTTLVHDTCLGNKPGAPTYCDLSEYSGFSGQLYDPLNLDSNKNPRPFMCTENNVQVPCNKIPNQSPGPNLSYITDQSVALLSLLPLPNYTSPNPSCGDANICDNFLTSGAEDFNADQFDLRGDYNASSKLRVFGRYSFGDFRDQGSPAFGTAGGGTGTNPSGFAGLGNTRNQGIGSGFTYSLGPKTLTDFRFGYFRYKLNVDSLDNGQIPKINRIPGIFAVDTGDPFATGLPDIEIPGQEIPSSNGYLRFGYSSVVNSCNCPLREQEQQFQFVNNWTRSVGRHLVKWGADVRYLQNYRLESRIRRTGALSFASSTTGNPNDTKDSPGLGLATFLIGDVDTFQRFFSGPEVTNAGEHQRRFGFYLQDTWRVNPRLTLNYGLRWEVYTPQTATETGGFLLPSFNNPNPATTFFNVAPGAGAKGGVKSTYKNFAPRLGIAYLLNPTTVMRAGYGRSFDAGYNGDLFGIAATQNPPVTVSQNTAAPGFNLTIGPPPFIFPQGNQFSLLDLASANFENPFAPAPKPSSGAVLYGLPSRVRVPTVDSWNLTIQHELKSGFYLELAYLGNKGTNVFTDNIGGNTFYDLNQATLQGMILKIPDPTKPPNIPNICRKGVGTFFYGPGETYCLTQTLYRNFYKRAQVDPDPCPSNNPCFINPSLFPVRYFGNNASDNYNSLQAKLQKNFSHGFSFMAHYTWSKGLDYDSNYFRVDPSVGYGPASFDVSHRFVMTNIWELPIGRGRTWFADIGPTADRFVGGWRLSAITVWRSGLPFTPSYRSCAQDVDGGSPCRPNIIGTVHISGDREQYFSTTGGQKLPAHGGCTNNKINDYCPVDRNGQPAPGEPIGVWQRPGAGQIGDAGRNSLRGPGFFESDVGLEKIVTLTERANLHFRVDAFNVFNRVNLANPNTCVDCTIDKAGVINSLTPGALQRTLQFSLQIQF